MICRLALIATAVCFVLAGTAQAQTTHPGDLDRAFGSWGIATANAMKASLLQPIGVVPTPDGRVYGVGVAAADERMISVSRWLPDGTLDASWPGGGDAEFSLPGNPQVFSSVAALQPDGKLVIGGSYQDGFLGMSLYLLRLNADGTRDQDFAKIYADNVMKFPFALPGGFTVVADVAVQANRILVAGTTIDESGTGKPTQGLLLAFRMTGADAGLLDGTFASSGIAEKQYSTDTPAQTSFNDVTVGADQSVWVGGSVTVSGHARTAVVKYTAAGQPAAGWGTAGVLLHDGAPGNTSTATRVLPRDDGKIVVVQPTFTTGHAAHLAPLLLNAQGDPDPEFGPSGQRDIALVPDADTVNFSDAILDASGRLVVSGTHSAVDDPLANEARRLVLARIKRDGTLDGSFATNGVRHGVDSYNAPGGRVAETDDGHLVVGLGEGVARFNATTGEPETQPTHAGELDLTFATRGTALLQFGAGSAPVTVASDVLNQGDKGYVIVGSSTVSNGQYLPSLWRLTRSGELDPSFVNGRVTLPPELGQPFTGTPPRLMHVEQDSQGRLVIVGLAASTVMPTTDRLFTFVARFSADGVLDTTYGVNGFAEPDLHRPGAYQQSLPTDLAMQGDSAVVAGASLDVATDGFVLRLDENGHLDPSFDEDGMLFVDPTRIIHDIDVLPDGKLLIAGESLEHGMASIRDGIAGRLTQSGAWDTSFNGTGYTRVQVNVPGGLDSVVNSITPLPEGRFLLAGGGRNGSDPADTSYRFGAARLLASGAIDSDYAPAVAYHVARPQFDADGAIVSGNGVVTPDGKFVLSGVNQDKPETSMVGRLRPEGDVDLAFGSRRNKGAVWGVPGAATTLGAAAELDGNDIVLVGSAVQPDLSQGIAVRRMRLNTPPTTGASGPSTLQPGQSGHFTTVDPADADASPEYGDSDIRSTVWDFGDGTTAAGDAADHAYAAPGTYTARVTLTDQYGATGSAVVTVTVPSPRAEEPPKQQDPVTVPTSNPPVVAKVTSTVSLPSSRKCVSRRRITLTVRTIKGVKIKRLDLYVGTKRVKRVSNAKAKQRVTLKGLPKGTYTVKVVATLSDGRRITDKRKFKTCATKRTVVKKKKKRG